MTKESVEIPLKHGKVAIIDAEDYPRVSQYKWHAYRMGLRKDWYVGTTIRINVHGKIKSTSLSLHRFLLNCHTGDGVTIDHQDHDGLNNRKRNLRKCDSTGNVRNSRKFVKSEARYKGITRKKDRWRARIYCHGKRLSIGSFSTQHEAALAYDAKAKELFGEFAALNFA